MPLVRCTRLQTQRGRRAESADPPCEMTENKFQITKIPEHVGKQKRKRYPGEPMDRLTEDASKDVVGTL